MRTVTVQTLKRLPLYLNYLKSLSIDNSLNISATIIAVALNLGEVQVRKDLAMVSCAGRPKIGHEISKLIIDLELFLGYNKKSNAIIVGAGNLGQALLSYNGFNQYGLNIVAGFDIIERETNNSSKKIYTIDKIVEYCSNANVNIGIITVPVESAQKVCDLLVENNIKAIWNFAPIHLIVPEDVLVQNENMASSLALLSNHLFSDENK